MFRAAVYLLSTATAVRAFSSALFGFETYAPSVHEGVDVELPDFDELFDRVQQVSPLARQVMTGGEHRQFGLAHIDDKCKWPTTLATLCASAFPSRATCRVFPIRAVESRMEKG